LCKKNIIFKRIFDISFSIIGIILFSPLFIIISVLIKLDSKGDIIFKQTRITINNKEFQIYKFRTMNQYTENTNQLTIGEDKRITKIGYILRKSKLDEIPQLINILLGDMSFVGPRPEVPKYVKYYTDSQREILNVKSGLTDYASIFFSDENDILGKVNNPEEFYINEILPYKIELNK
jgi:lipopolysaccharide/colanic/teichoic acid biosynthesis glycosyltransferase